MAPWVQRVFIQILPKILCIERPKKDDAQADEQPPEVLTDIFHVPPDVDKFVNYDSKRFSGDFGMPGNFAIQPTFLYSVYKFTYLIYHKSILFSAPLVPIRCIRLRRYWGLLW